MRGAGVLSVMRRALRGQMPERYSRSRGTDLTELIAAQLKPNQRVLDVGAGNRPTVPIELRPEGCVYVGFDLSMTELDRAAPGSYDKKVEGDIAVAVAELLDSIDLVVCVNVLEHVSDVPSSMETLRSYLKADGVIVAEFSAGFSPFALANRVLPSKLAVWLLHKLLGRRPENVFPVHYDHCWYSAVERVMEPWSRVSIRPLYRGAGYFRFFKPLLALVVGYEEWTERSDRKNLASHYQLVATR